jgi:hypothetical protein
MKRIAHKTALHFAGWSCLFIGFMGLILPIIPGVVFLALGVYLLSLGWLWLWTRIETIKTRFPSLAYHYDKIDTKISRYIKKVH